MTISGPWPKDADEHRRVREPEREAAPFLLLRDPEGTLHLHRLPADGERVLVGRREGSDLALPWDDRVSRAHAALERFGDEWAVVDEGLSRNGTFVNEERVQGRRRLRDGDLLRVGRTSLLFRHPTGGGSDPTVEESTLAGLETLVLTPTQRRILAALARPLGGVAAIAAPATNEAVAAELHLSVDAVKAHLRVLFRKFGIEDLPQNQKRTRLAAIAVACGIGPDRSGEPAATRGQV